MESNRTKELWGGCGMKKVIVAPFDYLQFSDTYYEDKEDSYNYSLSELSKTNSVHLVALTHNRVRTVNYKGINFFYSPIKDELLQHIESLLPDMLILSGYNTSLNVSICQSPLLRSSKKLVLFVGGRLTLPPSVIKYDWIFVSSETMKQTLIDQGGKPEKIINCSFCVDTKQFKPNKSIKKIYDIIYCADWRENKRQDLLLRTLLQTPDVSCLFIGAQDGIYNKDYFREMQSLILNPKLKDRITVINRVKGVELPIYYQQSKVGIHLGMWSEGGARSPLEAMSSGLPVIVTTDCLSNTSRIDDHKEGIYAQPTEKSLSEAIQSLLQDNKLRSKLGSNARKKVIKHWTYNHMLSAFTTCLEKSDASEELKSMRDSTREALDIYKHNSVTTTLPSLNGNKGVYLFGFFGHGYLADEILRIATENLIKRINSSIDVMSRINCPLPQLFITGDVINDITGLDYIINFLNTNTKLVVFCGGTWFGKLRIEFANYFDYWKNRLKVPYIIFGTGWREEFNYTLSKLDRDRLCEFIMRADFVGLRGKLSVEKVRNFLAEEGKDKHIECIGDPIMSLDIDRKLRITDNIADCIGTNFRLFGPAETAQSNLDNTDTFSFYLVDLICQLRAARKLPIRFYPMTVPSGVKDLGGLNDQCAYDKFFKRRSVDNGYSNLDLMIQQIANSKINVGVRLHFQLLSLIANIPFIPIEYQFNKMRDTLSANNKFCELEKMIIPFGNIQDISFTQFEDLLNRIKSLDWDRIKSGVGEVRKIQEKYIRGYLR